MTFGISTVTSIVAVVAAGSFAVFKADSQITKNAEAIEKLEKAVSVQVEQDKDRMESVEKLKGKIDSATDVQNTTNDALLRLIQQLEEHE